MDERQRSHLYRQLAGSDSYERLLEFLEELRNQAADVTNKFSEPDSLETRRILMAFIEGVIDKLKSTRHNLITRPDDSDDE